MGSEREQRSTIDDIPVTRTVNTTTSQSQEHGRFNSLRTAIGEWKQLFDGCNFIKRKDRSRSRRKDVKEGKASKRGLSASQLSQGRASRKSPSQELCVCDSIDDTMVERFSQLPPGLDQNEWLASHTLALFDHVNALCGSVCELCTPVSCPHMCYPGTSKQPYMDEKGKRHQYSAPQYIDCVMSLCEKSSKSEDLFPTRYGSVFSGEFEAHCRRVMKLLWHCCGHLYSNHWDQLGVLELRPQCALVMGHLAKLSKTFGLLDAKDQQLVNNTVQLIRPVLVIQSASRPFDDPSMAGGSTRWSRVPNNKSGSWGGHPTPQVLSAKPYAQTC